MGILVAIALVLLIVWLIGAVLNVVGALIHLVLIGALILIVYSVTRRR